MKRVFLAAALAFALHGLLFWVSPVLLGKKNVHKTQRRTVTLNLITRKTPGPTPESPSPAPTAATDETVPKIQEILKKPEIKQETAKNPPSIPEAEIVPTPEKTTSQTVKKEPPPIPEKKKPTPKKKLTPAPKPEKKKLTPKKKIDPSPKKITKPKKMPARKKKEVKVMQAPKPLPPKPAKKAPETKSKAPEKKKGQPSISKKVVPSDRQAVQSLNPRSQTPVTDAPSPPSLLDVKEIQKTAPGYKNNPAPAYPRKARRRGYEGTVILNVLVSKKGVVMQIRLSKSSGHRILDTAAEKAVREWVFEPGSLGTKKIEMWVNVPVRFDLKPR